MKQLKRAIMADYEIPENTPSRAVGVQFGANETLLGVADRLIDDANRTGSDAGLALVDAGGAIQKLREQDHLYTLFARGDLNDREVRVEQVIQPFTNLFDPEKDDSALLAFARTADVSFILIAPDPVNPAARTIDFSLAARFLFERGQNGGAPVQILTVNQSAEDCRAELNAIFDSWGADTKYLSKCPVISSLLEGMAYLSAPDEAVRLCEKMNYRDSMIHIAEPFARWTIQCAPDALPFSGENIVFTDDLAPAIQKKQALFDGGLFAFAALGALHGNRTLADCMRDKPLRDLAGHAIYDEILPFASIPRDEAAEYVIQSCERWENPLIENRIFDAAAGMLSRFREGVLPIMKAYCDEKFEAPERLSLALAATILLYAGARWENGAYRTEIGGETFVLRDDPEALLSFSRLSPDMPAESLAYACLADRTLWGMDLRELDGLEMAVCRNLEMVISERREEK